MRRARFIAGAVCKVCGSTDRIVVEQTPEGLVKRCVQCGDRAVLDKEGSRTDATSLAGRIVVHTVTTDDR